MKAPYNRYTCSCVLPLIFSALHLFLRVLIIPPTPCSSSAVVDNGFQCCLYQAQHSKAAIILALLHIHNQRLLNHFYPNKCRSLVVIGLSVGRVGAESVCCVDDEVLSKRRCCCCVFALLALSTTMLSLFPLIFMTFF